MKMKILRNFTEKLGATFESVLSYSMAITASLDDAFSEF